MGVRGVGPTKAEAFRQAALAMMALAVDPAAVRRREPVEVSCTAPDSEVLLVDWLNALVLEMSARHMLFADFEVATDGARLDATAWGETVDPRRHAPGVEVKGATFTALDVHRDPESGEWVAQCIVDV